MNGSNTILLIVVITLALFGLIVVAVACGRFWWVPVVLTAQVVGMYWIARALAIDSTPGSTPRRAALDNQVQRV
jgi:hypothetical protein